MGDTSWTASIGIVGTIVVVAVVALVALALLWGMFGGIRIIDQTERGIVLRFGRARTRVRQPGLTLIVPIIDRLRKVNVQIVTLPIPSQEGITRDNVSVKVDAVVYFKVSEPYRALIEVQNYVYAVQLLAQTSLRSTIGKSELDELLSNREELHRTLVRSLEAPSAEWGLRIDRVEIKDVTLPESMKRSMSKQAEAERERRARVITADGEFRAAQSLADASTIMAATPGAMQLRLLQTVVEVAAEKNSTLVMPFPVELLRFVERLTSAAPAEVPATAVPAPRVDGEST
jgi:regulator of protease activity HflC (stomatin/prohibitin superfamily)